MSWVADRQWSCSEIREVAAKAPASKHECNMAYWLSRSVYLITFFVGLKRFYKRARAEALLAHASKQVLASKAQRRAAVSWEQRSGLKASRASTERCSDAAARSPAVGC